MLLGWTLALSSLVLCLSMQNFAPVSRLALDPYSLNASLGFPYPAQNSWPPVGLQTTGPYQQQGPYQPQQGHQWNAPQVTQNNSTIFYPSTPLQQNQNHQFNFTNPMSGPNYKGWSQLTYQTWQQPQAVGFVAVPDTSLASDAAIPPLSVTPFGLAAAILGNIHMHPWQNLMLMKLSLAKDEAQKQYSVLLWMMNKQSGLSKGLLDGKILTACLKP